MMIIIFINCLVSLIAYKSFSPEQNLLSSAYNQEKPVYDLVIDKPEILASSEEYSYAFWLRWSFTGPVFLRYQQSWHAIARLTINKDHSNFQKGDRVLALWLGNGYYHFTTYTKHNNNLYANINYGSHLEGIWNFVYFTYKSGSAKAYLWLAAIEMQEVTIQSNHLPLQDYLHFIIQKEFDCPLFNGYYSMIQLRIGENAFLSSTKDVQKLATNDLTLPIEFKLKNEEGSMLIEEHSLDLTSFAGRIEYSISGWVQWVIPSTIRPYHFVVKLSLFKPSKIQEFTMLVLKSPSYFHFATYDEYKEKKFTWNAPFSSSIELSWTYIYFGYKSGLAFALVKFSTGEEDHHIFENVKHFIPTNFHITLKKDDFFPPFSGEMRQWTANFGDGSFTQKPIIVFHMRKMKTFSHDPITETYEEEIEDASGALEYGFGFWSRFLWNTEKKQIIQKPKYMSVAKLSAHNVLLAILLGQGYYQMIAEFPTISKNINYNDIDIDARWVYIYFGYKRFAVDKGNAFGWVLLEEVKTVEFGVLHAPVAKSLHILFGSNWKGFNQFNGNFGKIKLLIGENAYLTSDSSIRKLAGEIPKMDVPKSRSLMIKEEKVEEIAESNGSSEYSVELWFRWIGVGGEDASRSCIYLISYFDEELLGDNKKAGDRVLGLYQTIKHEIEFHSYTSIGDSWEKLLRQCQINNVGDQIGWMYSYFGYSKEKRSVYIYLKSRSEVCEGRMEAVHRLPHKLWLYLRDDGYTSNFNGRIAFLQESDFENSQTFLDGQKLQPSQIEWNELAHVQTQLDWEKQDILLQEFVDSETQVIDGQREYGYGFWSKYLTAFPHRLPTKPTWISVARLTTNKKHQDKSKPGDRLLATFIGKGYYHFTTYEKFVDINYHHSLEGIWNFIYYSYKGSEAIAFLKFGDTDQIQTQQLNNLQHRVLTGYAKFRMGAEFDYIGFPGIVTGLIIRFDKGAFIKSSHEFNFLSSQLLQKPIDHIKEMKKFLLVEKDPADGDDIFEQEWEQEFLLATEYNIFGWFKSTGVISKQLTELMRLTNNEKSLSTKDGYYTLCVTLIQNYELITYSYDKPAIKKSVPVEYNLGSWTYFYMQYSSLQMIVNGYVWSPGKEVNEKFENIHHMVPGYLAFYAGGEFDGKIALAGTSIGRGSFKEVNFKENLYFTKKLDKDSLPSFSIFDPSPKLEWRDDIDKRMVIKAKSIEFAETEQFSGATEYAFGVWTRWLTDFPTLLTHKIATYSIATLKSQKKLLSVNVAKGVYQFTSSDHQALNVPYTNYLEGYWNFIYFGYRQGQATGFVHFSELKVTETIVIQINHQPLLKSFSVSVMGQDFASAPFHGQLYDFIIRIGQGYIEDEKDFKQQLYYQTMPDLPKATYKATEEKEFENTNYATSYSIQGWMKFGKIEGFQKRLIARLTSNKQFKDSYNPGDRTLTALINMNTYKFSTYSLQNIDNFHNEKDTYIQSVDYTIDLRFKWQHVYFGYDFSQKKAYGTIRQEEQIFEAIFIDIYHIIPKNLYFYLGSDGILNDFEGDLLNWDLHVGPGSYTESPEKLISRWPSAIQLTKNKQSYGKKLKKQKKQKKKIKK